MQLCGFGLPDEIDRARSCFGAQTCKCDSPAPSPATIENGSLRTRHKLRQAIRFFRYDDPATYDSLCRAHSAFGMHGPIIIHCSATVRSDDKQVFFSEILF
jgi:hypothetical protein